MTDSKDGGELVQGDRVYAKLNGSVFCGVVQGFWSNEANERVCRVAFSPNPPVVFGGAQELGLIFKANDLTRQPTPPQDTELVECLRGLVDAIDSLMEDSIGVVGLHMNGDVATWGELTSGGGYEQWLIALEPARAALSRAQEGAS